VILVTELTVAGLNRARRQLDLLKSQHLDVEVRIVVNRFDKTMARTVSLADAKRVLNHDIAYTVSNDFPLMRAAIDRGIPIHEIKRKSPLARDLDLLDAGIAAALDLGR
jgi:pilus assembly protein CpaE